jgi:hypothetical protein
LSRKIIKGAFIAFDPSGEKARAIAFQLNPETIQRRLRPTVSKTETSTSPITRERISFILQTDANLVGDIPAQDDNSDFHGVMPYISAIELLATPLHASEVDAGVSVLPNWIARFLGLGQSRRRRLPPPVGLQLGIQRIIPIKIVSIAVNERAFDSNLQPINASLDIAMDVLTEEESRQYPEIHEMYEHYRSFKLEMAEQYFTPVPFR